MNIASVRSVGASIVLFAKLRAIAVEVAGGRLHTVGSVFRAVLVAEKGGSLLHAKKLPKKGPQKRPITSQVGGSGKLPNAGFLHNEISSLQVGYYPPFGRRHDPGAAMVPLRIHWPDGVISTPANLTRCKDAIRSWVAISLKEAA